MDYISVRNFMGHFIHEAEIVKFLNFFLKHSSESWLHNTAKLVRGQIFLESKSNKTFKQEKKLHKNHMWDKIQHLIIVMIFSGIAFYEKLIWCLG